MADERVDELIIDIKIREENARRVTNALRGIRQETRTVAAGMRELDSSGSQSTKGIDKATNSVSKFNDELRELRANIEDNRDLTLGDLRGSIEGNQPEGFQPTGRGRNLARIGSEIRQLPSTQIPGLGIGTDAIGNVLRLGGAIGRITEAAGISGKALIGASVAGGVLAGALLILTTRFNDVKRAAQADADARTNALRLLQSNNKEEIQARINTLTEQRRINQEIAQDANANLQALRDGIRTQLGDAALLQSEFNALIGTGAGELAALKDGAAKANEALNATSVELDVLQSASGLAAQSVADLAAQEAHLKAVRSQQTEFIAELTREMNAEAEARRAIATGTSKQVQDRLKELSDEIIANAAYVEKLRERALADKAAGEENQLLIDEINKVAAATDALSETYDALNNDTVTAAIKAREAAEEQAKIRDESISATKKYLDDVANIEEKNFEARAAIEGRYQDTLAAIAERTAEAAAAALQKLIDAREKLTQGLGQAQLDAQQKAQFDALERQIDFQQDEARAARNHADELLKIRRDAADQEQDLIAARDFSGLARLRRDTTRRISDTTSSFTKERSEQLLAFQQKNEAQARQFVFEAQQRQEKYAIDLANAEAQYKRELAAQDRANIRANQKAEQARINDLNAQDRKYRTELIMRYNAIGQELTAIAQGNAGKLALEAQYYQQSQNLIQRYLNSTSSGGSGGAVGFGIGQTGAFSSNRQAAAFVVNQTNNIQSGLDANKVAEVVDNRTIALLRMVVPTRN